MRKVVQAYFTQEKRNMDKFLVERLGAGKYRVGSVVELTDSEAKFYSKKVKLIPSEKPKAKLEVATPKAKPKPKAKQEKAPS